MQYEAFQLIDSMNNGALVTGGNPNKKAYLLSDHATDMGAYVTVNEIGTTGNYVISYDPVAHGDAMVVLTFGSPVGTSTLLGDLSITRTFKSPASAGLTAQATRDALELAPTGIATPQIAGAVPRLNATLNTPETTKTALALPAVAAGAAGGLAVYNSQKAMWQFTGISGIYITGTLDGGNTYDYMFEPSVTGSIGGESIRWETADGLCSITNLFAGAGWRLIGSSASVLDVLINSDSVASTNRTEVKGTIATIEFIPIQAAATAALNAAIVPADAVAGSVAGLVGDKLDAKVSGVAKTVWDYATSAATVAGSIGKRLLDFVTTLVYTPGSVTIVPIVSIVGAGAVTDETITLYQGGAFKAGTGDPFTVTITDSNDTAVNLSGKTVKFVVHAIGSTTNLWQVTCSVTGTNNNIVNITQADTNTQTAGTFRYVIWNTTDDVVVGRGTLIIEAEAQAT